MRTPKPPTYKLQLSIVCGLRAALVVGSWKLGVDTFERQQRVV